MNIRVETRRYYEVMEGQNAGRIGKLISMRFYHSRTLKFPDGTERMFLPSALQKVTYNEYKNQSK